MKKRGQFDISFGMIFSIIIIIAIIAVAFYVIKSFFFVSECTKVGLFYDDLKTHINKAWQSTIHEDIFTSTLPSGIELVCFGNLAQNPAKQYQQTYNEILRSNINSKEKNVFIYPERKSCDNSLRSIELDHITTSSFLCVPVKNNQLTIKTKKDQFESLVTISA